MINQLLSLVVSIISKSGYAGLFLFSAVESMAIPIPSEVVLPFSGFLASIGRFSLTWIVLISTLANLTGCLILYFIGRSGGRWILEKYGKYILINSRDLAKWDAWFIKHGDKAMFWSRLIPGVRSFSALSGGITQMKLSRFSLYTVLGSLPWNFVLAYAGYKAGEHWDYLHPYFQKIDFIIGYGILALIVWYIYKKKWAKNT